MGPISVGRRRLQPEDARKLCQTQRSSMFKVERVGKNRLDIQMSGKLNSEDMVKALNELVEKCKGIKNGKLLFDVVDYHLPSFKAISIEMSRIPSMLGFIKQFKRAAVLSERTWLKVASEIEGALIPGLEIKAFNRDQRAEAEAWLGE